MCPALSAGSKFPFVTNSQQAQQNNWPMHGMPNGFQNSSDASFGHSQPQQQQKSGGNLIKIV